MTANLPRPARPAIAFAAALVLLMGVLLASGHGVIVADALARSFHQFMGIY